MPRTTCPHCRVNLDAHTPQTTPPMGTCPRCHSSFYLAPDGMPTLLDLQAAVADLDDGARGLIGHFANNKLAAVVQNLAYLADLELPADAAEAVADAREGCNALVTVIAALTTVDTNVQSR